MCQKEYKMGFKFVIKNTEFRHLLNSIPFGISQSSNTKLWKDFSLEYNDNTINEGDFFFIRHSEIKYFKQISRFFKCLEENFKFTVYSVTGKKHNLVRTVNYIHIKNSFISFFEQTKGKFYDIQDWTATNRYDSRYNADKNSACINLIKIYEMCKYIKSQKTNSNNTNEEFFEDWAKRLLVNR